MEGFFIPGNTVDLFTPEEHAVLSAWFETRPPEVAKGIELKDAMARLGFEREPDHYQLIDAVVAFVTLEKAEKRLPGWSALLGDGSFASARTYRNENERPCRATIKVRRQRQSG